MRRAASIGVALVSSAAVFHCGTVSAQGRGPSAQERHARMRASEAREQERAADPAVLATKRSELESWLRRLEGRFHLAGSIQIGPVLACGNCKPAPGGYVQEGSLYYIHRVARGAGDCVGIGRGPGMHCMFHVPWPDFLVTWSDLTDLRPPYSPPVTEYRWRDRFMDPAVYLIGIDPDEPGIRYLVVDGQSIGMEAKGILRGDMAVFRMNCPYLPAHSQCDRQFSIRAPADGSPVEWRLDVRAGSGNVSWMSYLFLLERVADSVPPQEQP